jgi:phosphoadenosine phosphosulfate reductase
MLQDKVKQAEDVLKLAAELSAFYYKKPLIVTYSGGKDSDVMLHIARHCLKPNQFEVLNSHTTVDAPETVYHIRKVFKELEAEGIHTEIRMPMYKGERTSMWKLIAEKGMPPTRFQRYCCEVLKEANTPNRLAAVGVREDESTKRQGRDMFTFAQSKRDYAYSSTDHLSQQFESSKTATQEFNLKNDEENVYDCKFIAAMKNHKETVCNPIYKFTEADVWAYVREHNIEMNPLYAKGYKRVGCVGCPLAGSKKMKKEFMDYPAYRMNYVRAFDKMIERRKEKCLPCDQKFKNGETVYKWWIGENPNQVTFDDLIDNNEENII